MVEVPPEGSGGVETEDAEDVEKIEVHVHVHRGNEAGTRRRRPLSRPKLTGVLFDRQGHYDRVLKRIPQVVPKRWSRLAKCPSCETTIPSVARHCPRCGAPRPRRIMSTVFALLGLGSVAGVFAISAHLLGDSVPEQKQLGPVGNWSDNVEYIVVEVPGTPSPFAYTPPPTTGSPAPQDKVAER